MPDPIFEDPRLVAIYDTFDGNRSDLNAYLKILQDLNVRSPEFDVRTYIVACNS